MTTEEPPLTVAGMARGFTGDDFKDGLIQSEPLPQLLFRGHPARVARPDSYLLSVDWVGMEDQVTSFAMGWGVSTDKVNDPDGVVTQIVVITGEVLERRKSEILAEWRPITNKLRLRAVRKLQVGASSFDEPRSAPTRA